MRNEVEIDRNREPNRQALQTNTMFLFIDNEVNLTRIIIYNKLVIKINL